MLQQPLQTGRSGNTDCPSMCLVPARLLQTPDLSAKDGEHGYLLQPEMKHAQHTPMANETKEQRLAAPVSQNNKSYLKCRKNTSFQDKALSCPQQTHLLQVAPPEKPPGAVKSRRVDVQGAMDILTC